MIFTIWIIKMKINEKFILMEMPGIEPGAFHMQSERATTALHPLVGNMAGNWKVENLFSPYKIQTLIEG